MIAVGLSWKMAIGACVLGNTVMGIVITVNGRIGATVSITCANHHRRAILTLLAPHTLPGPCSHALRLLLQLLHRSVPLCPCHRMARVSLSLHQLSLPVLLTNCCSTVSKPLLAANAWSSYSVPFGQASRTFPTHFQKVKALRPME